MSDFLQEELDQIDRFIRDEMSADEKGEFIKKLNSDPELKKKVDDVREIALAIETENVKSELKSVHDELYGEEESSTNRVWLISIAASIAVVLGFSLWYFTQPDLNEELYAEYVFTDPGLPVPMSATDTYDFYDAMVDYKTEDYEMAIEKWVELLEDEPENDTLLYYIGASHFNVGDGESAGQFLEKVSSSSSMFRYKAEYLLVLLDLKNNDVESVLNIEPKEESPFFENIKHIQDELN